MTDTTPAPEKAKPPRFVLYATIALIVSGVTSLIGGLASLGNKDWVRDSRSKALVKIIKDTSKSAKDRAAATKNNTAGQLDSYVNQQVRALVISSLITLVLCGFLAYAVYKGRHWSRWGVIGVWVLATLTGSFIGLFLLLAFASGGDIPATLRTPVVIAGVSYLAALLFTNLRPSVDYFALSRPDRAPKQVRSGLFGPKLRVPQAPAASGPKMTKTPAAQRADVPAATAAPAAPRSRTKQRASADAVSKGAELARSRAKAASKSRRTGS